MSKDYKKYLPRHSQDNFYMKELNELSDENLAPLVNDLLLWIKSMNLFISNEVVNLLKTRHEILKDTLNKHLADPKIDPVFKYNVIAYLIAEFDEEDQKHYFEELKRLVDNPTEDEVYAEVDLIAKTII